jgi:hypothetical protein
MKLAMPSVSYLGHEIVPNGTATDEAKVEAIKLMPPPKDDTELRAFLGSSNYYRRFNRDFSRIAAPLNRLLQDDVAWDWNKACQTAFEALKQKLLEAPILRRPDYKRPFEPHTDWSSVGLGAVLVQQDDEGREYVVAYASRSCNGAERNYSSYQGECLAAIWAVQHFWIYLYGRRFTLITDHEPLQWLMKNERLLGMLACWANILQEYDGEIKHQKGLKHMNADGLSHNPLPRDKDQTDARMDHCVPKSDSHPLAALMARLTTLAPDDPDTEPAEHEGEEPGEGHPVGPQERDIWQNAPVMAYLQAGRRHSPGITAKERDRIGHRSKGYRFENDVLYKRTAAGTNKVVLRPEHRSDLLRASGCRLLRRQEDVFAPRAHLLVGRDVRSGPVRGCRLHSLRPGQGHIRSERPQTQTSAHYGHVLLMGCRPLQDARAFKGRQPICRGDDRALHQVGRARSNSRKDAGNHCCGLETRADNV